MRPVFFLSLERKRESEGWPLHVGGLDGISCQHLHVLMTQLLQRDWEWQQDKRKNQLHGSAERPRCTWTTWTSRRPSDVARRKHIAKIMGDQEVHGWIAAALLREVAGLKDKRPLKMLKAPCRSQDASVKGSVDAPWIWLKSGNASNEAVNLANLATFTIPVWRMYTPRSCFLKSICLYCPTRLRESGTWTEI